MRGIRTGTLLALGAMAVFTACSAPNPVISVDQAAGASGNSGGVGGAAGGGGAGGAGMLPAGTGGIGGGIPPSVCGNHVQEAGEQCDDLDLGQATTCSLAVGQLSTGTVKCGKSCKLDTSGCAYCGDKVRNGTEECDGADLGGATCAGSVGAGSTGTLSCSSVCLLNKSGCLAPPGCGDGVRNGTEQCDKTDLGGESCATRFPGKLGTGKLGCLPNCTFDTSACQYCGDGKVGGSEQCDVKDLGGKTCASLLGPAKAGVLTCASTCQFDTKGCKQAIGMPCSATATCFAGTCFDGGFCTISCSLDSQCVQAAGAALAVCVDINASVGLCAAGCATQQDCGAIDSTWSCNNHAKTDGGVGGMCAPWKMYGGLQCQTSAQCTSSSCAYGYCQQSCSQGATDCGGQASTCVATNNGPHCQMNCTKDADCKVIRPDAVCSPTTVIATGATTKACF